MTDLSIPLPSLPARVSPGRAYFQCRNKVRQSRQDSKGKGKHRVSESFNAEGPSSLPYDAVYAGIKDSPLFQKLKPKAGNRPPEVKTRLYCNQRASRESDTPDNVEELAWCESTLIWSRGSSIYRKYSFSEDPNDDQTIQQALFAYFDVPAKPKQRPTSSSSDSSASSTSSNAPSLRNDVSSPASSLQDDSLFGPFHSKVPPPPWSEDNTTASASQEAASTLTSTLRVRALVILQSRCILLYYPDGQKHIVPCLGQIERLWAMERGILLERRIASKVPLPNWWPSTSSENDLETDIPEPRFYALLDPCQEAKPVSKVPNLFNIPSTHSPESSQARQSNKVSSSGQAITFCEQDEGIVLVSDRQDLSDPIIVTFNPLSSRVSVWSYANFEQNPLDEINSFRDRVSEDTMKWMNAGDTSTHNNATVRTSSNLAAYQPTLGKRRRSNEGHNQQQPSSEPDNPGFTTNGDYLYRNPGATAVSRHVTSLLERRKSQHNPDSTIADLLGSRALAEQRSTHAISQSHDKLHRRTSTLQNAISSSMDRRTSTTRNELSVSLDRMAIGASLMPSGSQASQAISSQHSAAPTIADPGHMAAQDRQERFEALVGHGELERETSLTSVRQQSRDDSLSDILISRLHSLEIPGVT